MTQSSLSVPYSISNSDTFGTDKIVLIVRCSKFVRIMLPTWAKVAFVMYIYIGVLIRGVPLCSEVVHRCPY